MESIFKIWNTNREVYLKYLNGYTLEQLNTIPEGFSNNLIWNIGHVVVVQQRLVYGASSLPMSVSDELFQHFKNGSKPTGKDSQAMLDHIKTLLLEPLTKTQQDYNDGVFKTYKEFTTSTGFLISSIEDAIAFNNYHEAMHLGIMMSIRKFV